MGKSKLTTAEDKLLRRGFDYATDLNVFDPYYDDTDVLRQLEINPNLKATELSKLTKLPSHRVIAAMMRLKAEGKLPVNPPAGIVVNFPGQDCSKGIEPPKLSDEPKIDLLSTDPPRLIEPDGQLSLFFDNSEEPPDPDDFKSLDEYHQQHEIWAKSHPELTQAMAERIALIEKSKVVLGETFNKGDRIQKTSNPKWVGEIQSISKKGLTVHYCCGFESVHTADELTLFSVDNSVFKVGDHVVSPTTVYGGEVYTVKAIYPTGMVGLIGKSSQVISLPSHWLNHHVEVIKPTVKNEPEITTRKRPSKGCGSGYLMVRSANVKRNEAKGKSPDIYYVYCYSYTNQYGKEIKSSLSVPRAKIAQVKSMVENKEHYVKIAKFLGKNLPLSY